MPTPTTLVSSPVPDIKFTEILHELIENSPYRKNRRPIWEELNITSGALSQYLSGQARPRFETLVALAHFFGVSLDYLMLGKEAPTPTREDARPYLRYVDWALADARDRVVYHDWLVAKIGRRLAARVDEIAQELTMPERVAGVVSVDDAMLMESYSLHTQVLCTNLENDLIFSENGEVAAGRFLHILARNVKSRPPRPYEFILPIRWDDRPWDDIVHTFRRVLVGELGLTQSELALCQFRRVAWRSFCGNVFYKLDMRSLKNDEPIFWDSLRPFASEDGWVGHLLNTNMDFPMQGHAFYSTDYLVPSLALFDEWFAQAEADI